MKKENDDSEATITELEDKVILFFLVNPKSGELEGKYLLDLNQDVIEFNNIIKNTLVSAHIYDITDENSYSRGKLALKKLIDSSKL